MALARRRRRIAIGAFLVLAAIAAAAAWWALRPTPADVAKRFEERIATRFPDVQTSWLADDLARVSLPSGVMLDVTLARAKAACRSRPPACTDQIDQLTGAIDRVTKLVREPRADAVRAVIVGESAPGYRYGYITEPLIGPLEIRYALVDGDASTFITPAIAERLGVKPAALRGLAVRQLERGLGDSSDEGMKALTGEPGVFVAYSRSDPPSFLLSQARMKAFANDLGTQQLYCAIPRRGLLFFAQADTAGREALQRAIAHVMPTGRRAAFDGVLVYDTAAAPATALSALN